MGVPCLSTILNFVEQGDYPKTWNDPEVFDDTERARKEKVFGICKAALIKAIVEVAGEEKNAEILWTASNAEQPGGPFVHRMVNWIQSYVEEVGALGDKHEKLRDDLVIAASLSLGNLCRRGNCGFIHPLTKYCSNVILGHYATALLSPPYALAPLLVSPLFLSPEADLKLKHAVLGFLKNLAQSASLSPIIHKTLGDSGVVQQLSNSGIWDERSDVMADVVQLNAINVVKHLCSVDGEPSIGLFTPLHIFIFWF
jgi:hypothetical protein